MGRATVRPSARARETWADAPCDPRVRAAPARLRPPPVRRSRPALGHRSRLVQAHGPLPRVRRRDPGRRRPALAADGPGGLPRSHVPARLPGDRGAHRARCRVRRPAPPAADPAGPGDPRRGPGSWIRRSRSWTAGSAATTARTSASPRATPWAWPSTSAPPRSSWSWSISRRARSSPSRRSRTRSASGARTS